MPQTPHVSLEQQSCLQLAEQTAFLGATVISGEGEIFDHGGVVVKGNRIVAVDNEEKISQSYPNATTVNASGYMMTPGLINAHTHSAMSFFRGLAHNQKSMIETLFFPTESKLTAELTEPLSYSDLIGSLRSGVTCSYEHYYLTEGIGKAAEALGVRMNLGELVADIGTAMPQGSLERAKDLINKWPFSDRITAVVAPHAGDTVSEALLKECADWAKTDKLPLHMHLSQTDSERQTTLKKSGISPVMLADRCGALFENSLVVHLVSADKDDLKRVADSGATIGFCPSSQIIYERLAPIKEFFAYNIPIALGTDCAASNDSANILSELKFSGMISRHQGVDPSQTSAERLFRQVTIDAAKAMGLDDQMGSIKEGKKADLVFFRKTIDCEPMTDPLVNLIYSMGAQHVKHVMVDGRFVLWQGHPVLIDEDDVGQQCRDAWLTIKKRTGLKI